MKALNTYSSFIKVEHTLFSIPLLFSGALIAASGLPSIRILSLVLFAGAGARVVALALNRIIDRHIDRLNPRTQDRHLSSGKMRVWEAWLLAIVGLVVYLVAAWSLSDFCLKLAWLPILAFAAYPYFKRFTKWTHVGLGLVWSLVPLGGFFAVQSSLQGSWPVFLLAVFCVFWLAGFDIIYATLDESFDRENKVHSLPGAWGRERALKAAAVFHLLSFVMLLLLYAVFLGGPVTLMLLAGLGICLYLEQKMSRRVDLAFFQMNVLIGFLVFFFVWSGIKGF